jgi:hypothetical protein
LNKEFLNPATHPACANSQLMHNILAISPLDVSHNTNNLNK